MKQIIAIGGGGFAEPKAKILKYILAQTKKAAPKIAFLPQASAESPEYVVRFFDTFLRLGATPTWVSLFGRVEDTWRQRLLEQDAIYVGGGNTKSMVALWQAWGVDKILREAYDKGIVLAGVSAGAICWFEEGVTDSVWPLGSVTALGFLEGSMCPHFDTEPERQPVFRDRVQSHTIKPGIALEDNTAAHYIDGKLHQVISEVSGKKAFKIKVSGEEIIQPVLL